MIEPKKSLIIFGIHKLVVVMFLVLYPGSSAMVVGDQVGALVCCPFIYPSIHEHIFKDGK